MAVSIVNRSQLEDTTRLDAEYYQPEYLNLEQRISRTGSYTLWGHISGQFITGPFGSEFNVENYVTDSTYRYVRGQDVKEFFLLDTDNVYIPQKDFERLNKYALMEGDILVSVVGTLGNVVVVDKTVPPAIFSCKSTTFRTKAVNPFYLIAYLNCQFGRALLQRRARGAVQTGLNIGDLRSLPIFLPKSSLQDEVAKIVLDARERYDVSKNLYSQAENQLLEELQLKEFKPEYQLSYTANLSKAFGAHRVDAEYFQPTYEALLKKIEEFESSKLGQIAERVLTKVKPDPAQIYKYIEISDIDVAIGETDFTERLGKELPPNARIPINGGELIISKVRPTRGAISIIPKELGTSVICSSAFSVFEVESPLKEYLYIVIRAIIGKLQMERPTTGTSYPTIRNNDVENMQIPLLSNETQQEIASLVQQSHEARRKAKESLEKAKIMVEQMIETASTGND